jgi:hypothetical protein
MKLLNYKKEDQLLERQKLDLQVFIKSQANSLLVTLLHLPSVINLHKLPTPFIQHHFVMFKIFLANNKKIEYNTVTCSRLVTYLLCKIILF